MQVKDMILTMLRSSGYTGLVKDDCGCSFSDFLPCGECCCNCNAGYLHPDGNVYEYKYCGIDDDPEEVLP